MKTNLLLALLLTLATQVTLAAQAPMGSEKMLWHVSGEVTDGTVRHTCLTAKAAPQGPVLCFGETLSSSASTKGFAILRNAKGQNLATYKVTPVGAWIHLYRTTEYVSNTDFYTRTLLVTDAQNKTSVLTETFGYSDEKDYSEKSIYTKAVTGNLPDGSRIALDYGFFFSGEL